MKRGIKTVKKKNLSVAFIIAILIVITVIIILGVISFNQSNGYVSLSPSPTPSLTPSKQPSNAPSTNPYDIDNDRKVTISDIITASRNYNSNRDWDLNDDDKINNLDNDFNGDRRVNILDVIEQLKILYGYDVPPAFIYPRVCPVMTDNDCVVSQIGGGSTQEEARQRAIMSCEEDLEKCIEPQNKELEKNKEICGGSEISCIFNSELIKQECQIDSCRLSYTPNINSISWWRCESSGRYNQDKYRCEQGGGCQGGNCPGGAV